MSQQASDVAAQMLDEGSTDPFAMWFDNLFSKRWPSTSFGADASLNRFVSVIWPLQQEADVCTGYPQVRALFRKKADIATSIVGSHADMLGNMDNAQQASLRLQDVRCPLELKRNGVESLPWKPLLPLPPP